ncbi:hypothetical protein ACFO4O_03295 [Glaciecola siphonariae]|uniref:Uncharacterized protein n=1 Tax=Glaciecola siphonariae TaxID=521012 RepID=A0ABV9LSD3_9ALTE
MNITMVINSGIDVNINDYIRTQNTINEALHSDASSKAGFALFASMLSEQLEIFREHIVDPGGEHSATCTKFPFSETLEGIERNTRRTWHLKVEADDYARANKLNRTIMRAFNPGGDSSCNSNSEQRADCNQRSSLYDFRMLACAHSYPLSMHNDPTYIPADVIANCPSHIQSVLSHEQRSHNQSTQSQSTQRQSTQSHGTEHEQQAYQEFVGGSGEEGIDTDNGTYYTNGNNNDLNSYDSLNPMGKHTNEERPEWLFDIIQQSKIQSESLS